MALTKVSGGILDPGINVAGIVTATGFDGPFIGGSDGINAGVGTFTGLDVNGNGDISGNLVVGGNLTANGDFTTLNTTLREVELLRVDADSSEPAGIITQTGAGNILSLYDGAAELFTVADGGNVTIKNITGTPNFNIQGTNASNVAESNLNFLLRDGNSADRTVAKVAARNTGNGGYGALDFYTAFNNTNTRRMSIHHSGNVGIASTLPDYPLDVAGSIGFSGQTRGLSQSASSPTYSFDGDSDTGMYRGNGVNILSFATAGTERLNLDADGVATFSSVTGIQTGVKIQQTALNYNAGLEINATNGGQARLNIKTSKSGTNRAARIDFYNQDAQKWTLINDFDQNGTNDLSIRYGIDGGSWGEYLTMNPGNQVELFHGGTKKFQTTGIGVSVVGIASATSFTAIESGVTGQYTRNQIIWGRDGYNYIDCTDNSGEFAFRMGSSQTTAFSIDTNADTTFPNERKLKFGSNTSHQLHIYHTTSGSSQHIIESNSSSNHLVLKATTIGPRANYFNFRNYANNATVFTIDADDATTLYFNSNQKLITTGIGVSVIGEVVASQDYPNIRPVLDFNFAATKKLKPEMTFTRQGEASFHDGVGSVKFVSDNEPRFEHDIVTGECKGLMFEGAGTNYSWYSRRFDVIASGSWVPQNGGATPTVTANTHTAPDGTSSGVYMADTISGATGTAFNGNVVQQQHTAGANVKHTFSIYIKLITSTQATIYIRDGATGSVSSASAIPNTRNWQRVVVTSSAALTNSTVHGFYIGNTNGTIAVWGSQIERSDYVTSYIKTEAGANGTRTADDGGVRLDGEDVTDVFNQGEGTLIAEVIPTLDETNQTAVGFYQDFGDVNRIELRTQGSNSANARFEVVVGSSSVVNMTSSAHAGVNNVSKYAFAFQENNYASTVNGGSVYNDTAGAFPHGTGIDSMIIGDAVYTKDQSMIIKRIMYYADRLPNSQLVTLTS